MTTLTLKKLFLKELSSFSKNNWWIYIMFFICISLVYFTNTWNITEIIIIFILHFISDILTIVMWDYYAYWEKKKWAIAQLWAFFIVTLIAIYSFLFNGQINYILSQISFFYSGIKSYVENVLNKTFIWLNMYVGVVIWIFIIFVYYQLWFLTDINSFLQIVSLIGISLSLWVKNEKVKYFWFLFSVLALIIFTWIKTYSWYLNSDIKWTDISFFLLPITVFISFLKNIKKYL